jgi:excinuclease UvrABC nuclease subunit
MAYEAAAPARSDLDAETDQATQVITRMAGRYRRGRHCEQREFCVSVVFARGGRNLGSSITFPKAAWVANARCSVRFSRVLPCAQHLPVLVRGVVEDAEVLEQALQLSRSPVRIPSSVRAPVRDGSRWRNNAQLGLRMRLSRASIATARSTRCRLNLVQTPQRLNVRRSRRWASRPWRRVSCSDLKDRPTTIGASTLTSRRVRLRAYGKRGASLHALKGEAPMPDLLLIDGGPGQVNAAMEP